MSGVAGGLACHMGHNPPERMAFALDRYRDMRFRVGDRSNGAITFVHRRLVVLQHIGYGAVGWVLGAATSFAIALADETRYAHVPGNRTEHTEPTHVLAVVAGDKSKGATHGCTASNSAI